MNWRNAKILSVCILLLTLLGACNDKKNTDHSNGNSETKTITLKLGYINSTGAEEGKEPPISGGEGWGLHNGSLKEALKEIGITKLEYYAFPNGPDLNEAMAAGEVDVGIFGDTPALLARSSGYETTFIGFAGINSDIWLTTNKKDNITSVEQLKGKTVATSKGSYMYRYLLGILDKYGIKNDVKIVHLLPPDAQASLESGDIAAYAAPTFVGPRLVKNGFPIIEEALKDSPELAGTSVTIATNKFLEENPNFISTWQAARTEAVKDLKNNLDEYYEYYAKVSKQDIDIVKESSPLENFNEESFPKEGLDLLEGTKKFLVSEG